jgi:hypothetical protein
MHGLVVQMSENHTASSPGCMQDISVPPTKWCSVGPELSEPHGTGNHMQQDDSIYQFILTSLLDLRGSLQRLGSNSFHWLC